MRTPTRPRTRTGRWAVFARGVLFSVLALVAALALLRSDARGDVPVDDPTFRAPLEIDNLYFPIDRGAMKVYLGRDEGARVTVVVTHLTETRDFFYDGGIVTCRAVQEHTFERGRLVEEEVSWYAQADDGSVWGFGQTEKDHDSEDGKRILQGCANEGPLTTGRYRSSRPAQDR